MTSEDFQLQPPINRRRSKRLINAKTKIKYNEIDDNSDESLSQKQKQNTRAKHLLQELESIEKQEQLPLNIIKKLQRLRIKLIHEVPPQHKIELTGAHAPTSKQRKQFQKYGPLRKGLYTSEEDKVIRENWNAFCELHNWDSKIIEPFFSCKHGKKYMAIEERQKFVQFLANGLPWRTLYSVYLRFKTMYCNKRVNVRYNRKEDKVILMYAQNKHLNKRNNKYTELAKLLRRTPYSISKHYRYLKKTAGQSKEESSASVEWTIPLVEKYIKTLLNVTLSEDTGDLKFAILPKPVWQKMEEKLSIDRDILKTFWQQLHMQLFSTRPIYLNDIKIQLIEYLYVKGISNTREIMWSEVASHFDGATPIFLYKVFDNLIRKCPNDVRNNFIDTVEYLYNTKIAAIKDDPNDKFLPRILYKDDELILLDEKNSNGIIADKYETDYCDRNDRETSNYDSNDSGNESNS